MRESERESRDHGRCLSTAVASHKINCCINLCALCKKCSSSYLFLLIVFVMVGLVFVLLPYIFNFLTVSVGAINGLIFYANILIQALHYDIVCNKVIIRACIMDSEMPYFLVWSLSSSAWCIMQYTVYPCLVSCHFYAIPIYPF